MIFLFHILYWHVNKLIHYIKRQRAANTEPEVEDLYFELHEKVTFEPSATADAEVGLKFDPPVYCQRYAAVQQILLNEKWRGKIRKVVDFGCAELSFFKHVKSLVGLHEALFVDIDKDLLEYNGNRVEPFTADFLKRRKEPLVVQILRGSISNPDARLVSTDAVICIEIIEHLYPDTLDALPHNVFHFIRPRIAVFTTPNADFNILFPNFSGIRHYDHKFEWTRTQFEDWAHNLTLRYPTYHVYFEGIGAGPAGTADLGCCSQMAVFVHKNIEAAEFEDDRKILVNALSDTVTKDCKFCALTSTDLSDFLSNGVCTYESHNNLNNTDVEASYSSSSSGSSSGQCEHCHMRYELIREVNYPYDIDNRTQDERIQHECEYRMHNIACNSRMYYNCAKDQHEIPIYELTANKDGDFISIPDLSKVLEKAGWPIEDCTLTEDLTVPCVIYTDHRVDSSSDTYTEISQSPDLNFSTDVNWDSGSQWDAGSGTEMWDDAHSNMDTATNTTNTKSEPTKDPSTEVWETASSNGHSAANATNTKSEVSETLPFESCTDGGSPDCASDDKIELLFDSGYQMSTSSLDLSPENVKEWLNEEKKQTDEAMKARSEVVDGVRIFKKPEEASNSGFKADGSVFSRGKRHNSKLDEMPVQRAVVVPVVAPPPPPLLPPPPPIIVIAPDQEAVEVVENGDLANNNRDREGNNYQAAENDVQVDDNARPRPQNLDEHNENHIVLQQQHHQVVVQAPGEPPEDDDAAESLEDASREVLYDPNSESSFSEDTYLGERMSFEEYNLPVLPENPSDQHQPSVEELQVVARFPDWLLNILDDEQNDIAPGETDNGDFFSQGDGLGIHQSMLVLPGSGENSSSSSSSQDNARQETTPTISQDTLLGVDSSMDATFVDALDHFSDPNLETDAPISLSVLGVGVNRHQNGVD